MLKVVECKYNWQCLSNGLEVTYKFSTKIFAWKVSVSHARLFLTTWTAAYETCLPWDFPGKDTGVGCHLLLQGIFLTQGSNPGLLHCRQILYLLSYKGILEKSVPNGAWNLNCEGKDRYKLLDLKISLKFL